MLRVRLFKLYSLCVVAFDDVMQKANFIAVESLDQKSIESDSGKRRTFMVKFNS